MANKGMRSRTTTLTPERFKGLVQKRAYELCQKRGSSPGNDLADWFEAEKQIRRELRLLK